MQNQSVTPIATTASMLAIMEQAEGAMNRLRGLGSDLESALRGPTPSPGALVSEEDPALPERLARVLRGLESLEEQLAGCATVLGIR